MSKRNASKNRKPSRRTYPDELKREAVQMYLDGHAADDVADRLGLPSSNLIYGWKTHLAKRDDAPVPEQDRVRELQEELARVKRERDILKKALAIFSRRE